MTENRERIIGVLIKNPETLEREAFPVSQTSRLTIGRSLHNHIYLTDVRIKRHHCVLYAEGEEVYLEAAAHSHTWVNGTAVHDRCKLQYGDVIVLGTTVFKFQATAG